MKKREQSFLRIHTLTFLVLFFTSFQNYPACILRIGTSVEATHALHTAAQATTRKQKRVKAATPSASSSCKDIKEYLDYLSKLTECGQKELKNIQGFDELMKSINSHKQLTPAKGFWFELEVALHINRKNQTKKSNEKLIALHYQLKGPDNKQREIDILTNKYCIECKNVHWKSAKPEDRKRILNQVLDQKKLVDWHNNNKIAIEKNYNIRCLFWSAEEIPDDIKSFLREHKIAYMEGLDDSLYATNKAEHKTTIRSRFTDLWNKIFSPLLSYG